MYAFCIKLYLLRETLVGYKSLDVKIKRKIQEDSTAEKPILWSLISLLFMSKKT